MDTKYALFAGTVIYDKKIIILCDKDKVSESILRLSRVGLDNVVGYLENGIDGWKGKLEKTKKISMEDFIKLYNSK